MIVTVTVPVWQSAGTTDAGVEVASLGERVVAVAWTPAVVAGDEQPARDRASPALIQVTSRLAIHPG